MVGCVPMPNGAIDYYAVPNAECGVGINVSGNATIPASYHNSAVFTCKPNTA